MKFAGLTMLVASAITALASPITAPITPVPNVLLPRHTKLCGTDHFPLDHNKKRWGTNFRAAVEFVGEWCDAECNSLGIFAQDQRKWGCKETPHGKNKIVFALVQLSEGISQITADECKGMVMAGFKGQFGGKQKFTLRDNEYESQ